MDMNLLLEEVIHNFKPILKQKKIVLESFIDDKEYYMMGDIIDSIKYSLIY